MLQTFALLFGISCTEIDQSRSRIISHQPCTVVHMYIINKVTAHFLIHYIVYTIYITTACAFFSALGDDTDMIEEVEPPGKQISWSPSFSTFLITV